MKRVAPLLLVPLFALAVPQALADTFVLSDGRTLIGTPLQTNGNNLLILGEYGTLNCPRDLVRQVQPTADAPSPIGSGERLSTFRQTLLLLSQQTWASNLRQIPATVIDAGVMKNVPYLSFRCGGNYEVNVYGDPANPAGVEIGISGNLTRDPLAKSRCERFLNSLLNDAADMNVISKLDWSKDLKVRDGLTFEVTPADAPDAYGAWWISVYSEPALNLSRASDAEIVQITTPRNETNAAATSSDWTSSELALARPASPPVITITTSFGETVTNAEVVHVNDGVSLVWRRGTSGGVVKLADLPEELRTRFGYDASKAAAAEAAEMRRRAQQSEREAQEREHAIANNAEAQQAAYAPISRATYSSTPSSGYSGGRVFVRGYYRINGTYVRPHTRSAPRR